MRYLDTRALVKHRAFKAENLSVVNLLDLVQWSEENMSKKHIGTSINAMHLLKPPRLS